MLPISTVPDGFKFASFGLLVTLFALLTALLLPRQTPFPYRYEKGQPWHYGTLKAPFDFEVLYPEETVQPEIARVNTEHGPYFILDANVAQQQKQRFAQLLAAQSKISQHDAQYDDLNANAAAYLNFGQQLLDHLYNQGIADVSEEIFQENPGFIYIYAGNTERYTPVRALLTVKTAQNFLSDTLPYSPLREPELILPMLEKTLVPNLHYSDSLTTAVKRKKLASVMSTGIVVAKGTVLVQRDDLISEEVLRKLDSLARRYDTSPGMGRLVGYFMVAWLAFGLSFFWLVSTFPNLRGTRERLLVPPVLVVLTVVLVNFGGRLGTAIPLLLPLWALPILLHRAYGMAIGLATAALAIFLTSFALDWSAGWLSLQLAGAAGMLLFFPATRSWKARGLAAAVTAVLQILTWAGAGLAAKLPDSLWNADVLVFLLVAAGFSLAAFPLSHLLQRQLAFPVSAEQQEEVKNLD